MKAKNFVVITIRCESSAADQNRYSKKCLARPSSALDRIAIDRLGNVMKKDIDPTC